MSKSTVKTAQKKQPATKQLAADSEATATKTTRREHAEGGFTASPALSDRLQSVLVDLIELQLQGKQAHWNAVGRNFRDTHLQLDEVVAAARTFGDEVAERMRALHAVPDGRSAVVSAMTTLPEYPAGEVDTIETIDLITVRIERTVATMREVHDDVDEEDPASADLLHAVIARLEQLAWMVSAEHRTPAAARA